MNALFHIGMPKSGSSALQSALSASSDYLASKGVFYPVNPKFPSSQNHRLFATQVAPVCKLPRHMAGFGAQEEALAHFAALHAHIRSGIAARRPNLLLLSAETMFRQIHPDFRAGLVAAFAALGPAPSFVAYLRRPSEHYVSGLQQVLRRSLQIGPQPRPPRYRKVLTGYAVLFGEDQILTHLLHHGRQPQRCPAGESR